MSTTDPRAWLIESDKIVREYRPTMHQDVVRAWAEDVSEVAPAMAAALLAVLDWCDTNQHPFHPSEGAQGFSRQTGRSTTLRAAFDQPSPTT